MAAKFPIEVLSQIAEYVSLFDDFSSLKQAASVSRKWKAAFEPFLYSSLQFYCTVTHGRAQQNSISVINRWTSGAAGISRRKMVRQLKCTIRVEYYQPEGDLTNQKVSSIQSKNDRGLRIIVTSLFDILKTWDSSLSITMHLCVEYIPLKPRPGNRMHDVVESIKPPAPVISIPDVQCIRRLSFEMDQNPRDEPFCILLETHFDIVRHCTALDELHIPFLNEGMQKTAGRSVEQERDALAKSLNSLPSSLRSFSVWHTPLSALSLLDLGSTKDDLLATNMGSLTFRLRYLKLYRAVLAPDFLFPLDASYNPIDYGRYWPNLELIQNDQDPGFTTAGEWDLVETNIVNESTSPSAENLDRFHRVFISCGHAARKMPRLATLDFTTGTDSFNGKYSIFRFSNDRSTRTVTATWKSTTGYKPDDRVAKAWGFRLSDMAVAYDAASATSKIELSPWPPIKLKI
ncbi:hypothetical protein BJX64DRAFT_291477 [Aspergillus heterothallicus]